MRIPVLIQVLLERDKKIKGQGPLRDLSKGPQVDPEILEIRKNDQNLIVFEIFWLFLTMKGLDIFSATLI